MPVLRASTLFTTARTISSPATPKLTSTIPHLKITSIQPANITRSFTRTTPSLAAHAENHSNSSSENHGEAEHGHGEHESHYDAPGGWLWGIKPGEKYEKEGWENIWIYGFFGGFGVAGVAYAFKPDTSIQTWALEEARRRLEAEGILKEPPSPK